MLQHPIPPPTHDTQYRAIGLVWGKYQPQDQFTRGEMILSETESLETVLLGRVMNVVKKHLNLEVPHLWVVYPRTRQKQDYLHLQIVGVWEPDTLKESSQRAEQLETETVSEVKAEAGYFSIRGEVVFYSEAEQKIIVKIKRFTQGKASFFKLKLVGVLPDEKDNLGWFWELDVQLKGEELVVIKGRKIAPISDKSKPNRAPKKIISSPQKKETPSSANKPKPVLRREKKRSPFNQGEEN